MTQRWLRPAAGLPDIAAPGVPIGSAAPSQHHDGCHVLMTVGSLLVWRYGEQIPKLLLACSGLLVSQAWGRHGSLLPSAHATNFVQSCKGEDYLFQHWGEMSGQVAFMSDMAQHGQWIARVWVAEAGMLSSVDHLIGSSKNATSNTCCSSSLLSQAKRLRDTLRFCQRNTALLLAREWGFLLSI